MCLRKQRYYIYFFISYRIIVSCYIISKYIIFLLVAYMYYYMTRKDVEVKAGVEVQCDCDTASTRG